MIKVKAKHNDKKAIFYIRENTIDDVVVKHTWERQEYTKNGYDINFGDIVIDIGAHIGTFTVLARSYGANIIAFEPEPENFKILARNLEINNIKAQIFKMAVGDTDKEDKLWINYKNIGGHSCLKGTKKDFIKVRYIAFETILNTIKRCDFLKLDCECAEYMILMNTNLDKIQKISMEYHILDKADKLVEYLKESGFIIDSFYGDKSKGIIQARRIEC